MTAISSCETPLDISFSTCIAVTLASPECVKKSHITFSTDNNEIKTVKQTATNFHSTNILSIGAECVNLPPKYNQIERTLYYTDSHTETTNSL